MTNKKDLKQHIRNIPDYPKPGIQFKDISTLLKHPQALKETILEMALPFKDTPIDYIVAVEARGFIFGTALATELNAGFIPVRKPGKLPAETFEVSYELEYGTDTLQIHKDAIEKGARVLIVDDLLATGGTVGAVKKLMTICEAEIIGYSFLIELNFLNGRNQLNHNEVYSLIQYDGE